MQFTEFPLDDRLQRALATAGFITPTPIQAAAIPVALEGRDLVGTAQTGTGKTAAFVLPILQRINATPLEIRKTRALILAPTRELVEQILAVVRELGIHTNIRAVGVYGGMPMRQQSHALRAGVEIVVACPGRLLDQINRRNADFRQLDCLVLDEADRMLDMGFIPSIEEIIDNLPVKRQILLFSATFAKKLNSFVQRTLCDPARVEVDTAVPAQTVRHTLYHVKNSLKPALLTALLQKLLPESDSVLIFTRTRITANQVNKLLYSEGMNADVLHSEKTQRERQDTLDQFRAGIFPYLVATDIAARGIDVTSISHVINYDLPANAEDYLHRIGRTGRMERAGHAISLVTKGDTHVRHDIERMLGKKIEIARLEDSDRQQSDTESTPHEVVAHQPKHHVTSPTNRPLKTHHHGEEERPRRTHRNEMPGEPSQRTERPKHARRDDASPRGERPRNQFGGENTPARPPRPDHAERKRRDGETPFAPKRRERSADNRFDEAATSGAPRHEHSGGKHFTGMASVSKYNRKHAAGKRRPGELPTSPRPPAKSARVQEPAPAQQSAPTPSARTKRPKGRGR